MQMMDGRQLTRCLRDVLRAQFRLGKLCAKLRSRSSWGVCLDHALPENTERVSMPVGGWRGCWWETAKTTEHEPRSTRSHPIYGREQPWRGGSTRRFGPFHPRLGRNQLNQPRCGRSHPKLSFSQPDLGGHRLRFGRRQSGVCRTRPKLARSQSTTFPRQPRPARQWPNSADVGRHWSTPVGRTSKEDLNVLRLDSV